GFDASSLGEFYRRLANSMADALDLRLSRLETVELSPPHRSRYKLVYRSYKKLKRRINDDDDKWAKQ
ncbi:hypothetical protein EV174_006083, partial [Coemansia sp. RSA 2320]